MSKTKIVLLISALASLSGCAGVTSLHPLAMPNGKDTVFDPALLGIWEEVKAQPDGGKTRYTIARAESGYSVSAAQGLEKHEGTMRLMKVGDRYLLDVYCPSQGAPPAVHLFVRLRLEKDTAWVSEMDTPWLRDQIHSGNQLRREVLSEDGNRILLTASTAELRTYLLPYVANNKAFGGEEELRRIK